MTITKQVTYLDDNGDECSAHLPARWEICDHCRGTGKSSAYLGAVTREDMDEAGPEFMEDYMAGHYDRPCDDCGGRGSVLVLDRERIETRADADEQAILAKVDEAERELAECRALEAAERRMGA